MKSQRELTILLRDAKSALGMEAIDLLLPKPLKANIAAHDTGCQVRIYSGQLCSADHVPIWEGSAWYSSHYEFNDRGKALGLHPQAQFASPIIERFFERVESVYLDRMAKCEAYKIAAQESERETRQTAVDNLRKQLSDVE